MEQTDAEILGSLREDILQAKEKGEVLSPSEWEKELEIMINANFMGQPEHFTKGESELWNRIMSEQQRKRVPRAWWGWSVKLYRYCKQEREDIKFIAGGILGLIGFVIVIVLINCL